MTNLTTDLVSSLLLDKGRFVPLVNTNYKNPLTKNEIYDFICYKLRILEDQQEHIDEHLREVWNTIISPYIVRYGGILDKLTEHDYAKFYSYMLQHNVNIQMIFKEINRLQNQLTLLT